MTDFTKKLKTFAGRFKKQADAAVALGVSESAISRYLKGQSPRYDTVQKLEKKMKGGK